MYLFPFEPGDGWCYRIIFGRMPAHSPFITYYTVFGIAEGSTSSGCWYAFDSERVNYDTFTQHLFAYTADSDDLRRTAWRLWLALTGQADDAAAQLPAWRDDWRRQLPAGALG